MIYLDRSSAYAAMANVHLVMLLVDLLLPPTDSITAIEPGCENCGCCVDKECGTGYVQGKTLTEYCTKGCIPGIGGNKCYNRCSDDCVTCDHTLYKNCATCSDGKYLNDSKRCVDCPDRCTACTSATRCNDCIPGYYGTYCSSTCRSRCKTCSSETQCQECHPPYYNAGKVTNCSLVCRDNCLSCSSYNLCTACKPGFYGTYCHKLCSSRCLNNTCYIDDGLCICRGTFRGKKCTECISGRYGYECDQQCPVGCKDGICNESGLCLQCKSENVTGEKCEQCKSGTWNYNCSSRCPQNCLDGICERSNGYCIDGCTVNYEGATCTQEIKGSANSVVGAILGVIIALLTITVVVLVYIIRRRSTETAETGDNSGINPAALGSSITNDGAGLTAYENVQCVPQDGVYNVPERDNDASVAVNTEALNTEYENTRIGF